MWKIFCFALLLTQHALSVDVHPGIKLRLSQKGLDAVNQVGKKSLENHVKALSVPNINGEMEMQGKLKYEITDIKIVDCTVIDSSLTLVPGVGLQMAIKNSKATIHSNWKVDHSLIKAKEKTVLELSEVSITVVFKISKNDVGLPLLSLDSCQSDIKKVEVKLRGAMEKIYKNFQGKLDEFILTSLNTQLCPALMAETKKWEDTLSTFPAYYNIDRHVKVNYQLVNPPLFTDKYMEVDIKGTMYAIKDHKEPPFAPTPFSLVELGDSMMHIGISEYVLNSLSLALYEAEVLRLTMNNTQIAAVVKELPDMPDNLPPVKVKLIASKAPVFTLKEKNMTLEFTGDTEVFTKEPTLPKKPVVTANIDASISADVSISEANSMLNVTGSLTENRVIVKIIPEDPKYSKLQKFLQTLVENKLVPHFIRELKQGFIFPNLPLFKMINPALRIHQGFIQISTDVEYSP